MGFSINDLYRDDFQPEGEEEALLGAILSLPDTDPDGRAELQAEVVEQAPEMLLAELLKHPVAEIRNFCAKCLWDIWCHERGKEAHEELRIGIRALERDELEHAAQLFESTVCRYPGWAEPLNKLATTHYLLRRPASSIDLCRAVIGIKPHHFGARNGLVYCAIQLRDWKLAAEALKAYWTLCPHAPDAPQLDRIIRENADG